MKVNFDLPVSIKETVFLSFLLFSFIVLGGNYCSAQDISLKVNLRGVVESKVTLLPLAGANALKPLAETYSNFESKTAELTIPESALPAKFVLRFDYKEKPTSTPYPCEKHIFISRQDLELWINPMYCNNSDSGRFQKDEKENTLFAEFTRENSNRRSQIETLQSFLLNYNDSQSGFYRQGIKEYEKKRDEYNQWLEKQARLYSAYFVSRTFQFHYVPIISFNGSETEKIQSVLANYFEGINFNDSLILNTAELKKWITGYVNIYGSMVKTEAERDSLFTLAGKTAIERARKGHPKVYGWMVDYFYNGFESFNIITGIKMLEPYLNDTSCLTTKRLAISKRFKGMKTLVKGSLAPDFAVKDKTGNLIKFHEYPTASSYKLLLFWSADCAHCKDLVSKLHAWQQQSDNKKSIEIFDLSLDYTETEILAWENEITKLPGWKYLRCNGGINSEEANAYFILATPVMILVDAKTNKILAIPENMQQLISRLNELTSQ
ncbi:MAG: thioredoxin-like domain-containing protein [Bacteroidia bacterium]